MFMESPIGDRNIIDIKVEQYKQIIPDNYIGRHATSDYDTCTVSCCYGMGKAIALKINTCSSSSSSIQLSAIGRLLYITHMCYEYKTPLLPGKLRQPRQSDLSVTSTLQSVSWWRHNAYSCCSHPSRPYICEAHLLSRSDQWSDGQTW